MMIMVFRRPQTIRKIPKHGKPSIVYNSLDVADTNVALGKLLVNKVQDAQHTHIYTLRLW